MQYLGSKRKIAKILLQTIESFRPKDSTWVEPFVGGANMIQFAMGKRIGNDSNRFLISLFKALQNGWTPPDSVSKEEYFQIRTNKSNYPPRIGRVRRLSLFVWREMVWWICGELSTNKLCGTRETKSFKTTPPYFRR